MTDQKMFKKLFVSLETLINSNYKANELISPCKTCSKKDFSYLRQMTYHQTIFFNSFILVNNQIKSQYLEFITYFLFAWKMALLFSFMPFDLKFPNSTV